MYFSSRYILFVHFDDKYFRTKGVVFILKGLTDALITRFFRQTLVRLLLTFYSYIDLDVGFGGQRPTIILARPT